MSNTAFDSNTNPIFVAASTNTIVAIAKLAVPGRTVRKVLLIRRIQLRSDVCQWLPRRRHSDRWQHVSEYAGQ